MTDSATFKLVNRWFNQLVEVPEEQQQITIKQLLNDKKLSDQQADLLLKMLAADRDQTLPDKVADLQHDWQHDETLAQINDQPIIGSYRLLELIGSGGMGHVYLADRVDGSYEQKVAIKVAQFHMNPALVKRFENERQILAKLSHPHIAQLLDGGTAANDQPYLVMEYIKGQSIDDYCITENLGLKGRLELVLQTCEAVSFAHQNLILHRDLKPANILVNETGQVKLLDFGIAKLLVDDVDQQQTMTQVMTRNYASPEQIKGEQVSTQSDLFSLAIIAYELVSGYHPFERISEIERDQNVVSGKIKRITARHSNPIEDPKATYPELSLISNEKLTGDLENILQKAMSPASKDRYISVEAFAQDIKSFLSNKTIQARKPSVWYSLRKAIQRQKLLSALVILTSFTLVFASLFSYNRALFAEQQTAMAQIEAEKSKAVADFLTKLFATSNPSKNQTEVMAQDILMQGFNDIEKDGSLVPEIKFKLLTVMYRSLWNLGKFKETAETIEKHYAQCVTTLGENHANCQALLIGQYDIHTNVNDYEKVLKVLNKAEAIELRIEENERENILIIYDAKLLTLMNLNQNELALSYGKKAMAVRQKFHKDSPGNIVNSMNNLALTYLQNQQFSAAMELIDQIPDYIEVIEEDPLRHESWAEYFGLKAFYYVKTHQSIKAAEFRHKAVEHRNKHFAVLNDSAIWSNRVLGSELAKAGDVVGALKQFGVAEKLFKAQVSNNESHLFRIYAERLMLYALRHDLVAAEKQWQLIDQLQFNHTIYSSHVRIKTVVDALFHLLKGDVEASRIYTDKMTAVFAEIKSPDSSYPIYQLIAEGRLQLLQKNRTEALKKFKQAEAYWHTYPDFNLHLKAAVKQHIDTIQLNP